ncbi:gamma-glutamylcysteine synthetase, partial [Streptococcus sp. E24BD]|uniref:gamma-glutamylcysteine synthetase n=2 Tax=unclassified Streptococcus TaxID=2608887 RepID=UPI00359EE4F0
MDKLKKALRDIYLSPLKETRDLYIGVELEFPIVHRLSQKTDIEVSKALMIFLAEHFHLVIEQHDADGAPVQLYHPGTKDRILFEVSYNILEFAFGKSKTIQEIDDRFQHYLKAVQLFLGQHDHELQGVGIHPAWDKNDNSAVKLPRYQMLMAYLALANEDATDWYHPFTDYGAFICSNQVQLDVTSSNYLRVLNAFNKIEAAKAYLFSNSVFNGADWDTTIARDIFWEHSFHGCIAENVGLFPHDFHSDDELLDYLTKTSLFTVNRDGKVYYFPPISLENYIDSKEIKAYSVGHTSSKSYLQPCLSNLETHRAYHYNTLTRRATIESRSVCTQPLDSTFAPIAFQLGLLVAIAELEDYLEQADFFQHYGKDYPALRRQFSQKTLSAEEKNKIRKFSLDLLNIARNGLLKRGFKEENYLT